jgi:DNA-binding NarL/FixJ family response regulator
MSHGSFNSTDIAPAGASATALLSGAPRRAAAASSLVIVHPTPLLRLGVEAALAAALPGRVLGFADLTRASDAIADLRAGDVILIDAPLWQANAKSALGLTAACERGARLALIANGDFPAARLQGARGVCGVVSCDISPVALAQAILDLAAGRDVFPKPHVAAAGSGLARLSNRQFEILELMTRGLLNKQIAWELGLTEGTVKSHVSAILEKLGCDRRTQAITAFMQSFGVAGRSMTA